MTVTPSPRLAILCLSLPLALAAGCSALGELAYESAVGAERQRCDRLESGPERKACQDKVRTASQQAEEARRQPSR